MEIQNSLFILFSVVVVFFLIFDLGVLNRKSHTIEFKSALAQSIFWIATAIAFGFLIFVYMDRTAAVEFFSAYVTEKMLSVDNLFVMLLIFSYFKLEEKYYHKVLFWGIIGAIMFRALFIGAGSYIVHQFHWVLYVFGVILIITAVKLIGGKKEEHIDLNKNKVFKLATKYLPFTTGEHGGKFLTKEKGKLCFTSLFLTLLLVETSDIIFAVDSIPAVFAISQNMFIVFTSNILAILGLRSLFFLIAHILNKFRYLQKGLAFILFFIGAKMLLGIFDVHISSLISFGVIMLALITSIFLSMLFPEKKKA